MNTGLHGRSAASAISRLRLTTSTDTPPLATSHSHSEASPGGNSTVPRLLSTGCCWHWLLGHGGGGASCSVRTAAPAATHAAEEAPDGSPSTPSAVPGTAARASTGGLRQSTSGVGIGA